MMEPPGPRHPLRITTMGIPADFDFDLVMFDLDGTLLDTAGELADAVNDTLAALGQRPVTEAQVRDWIGNGTRELLVCALADAGGQPREALRESDALARAAAIFDPHYENRCGTRSQPYAHAAQVLRQLRERGLRLAVVTNKDSRFTRPLLAYHQLAPLFDQVVCGDDVARKKPAPDSILHCLASCQVAPGRALFVGDSAIDVASARNAGVRVWAVPGGYNQGQPIALSQPDRLLRDLGQLLD
jgi:phosphoglycolate phosphatase